MWRCKYIKKSSANCKMKISAGYKISAEWIKTIKNIYDNNKAHSGKQVYAQTI